MTMAFTIMTILLIVAITILMNMVTMTVVTILLIVAIITISTAIVIMTDWFSSRRLIKLIRRRSDRSLISGSSNPSSLVESP